MPEWLAAYLPEGWNGWHLAMFGLSVGVISAIVSLAAVAIALARLPADYFVNPEARRPIDRHPVLKVVLVAARNLFGYCLIALGVILSIPGVPGQGILTILMGVLLIDFPGKHAAERWLLSRRGVLTSVNKLRARFGKPPLLPHDTELPLHDHPGTSQLVKDPTSSTATRPVDADRSIHR